MANQNEFSPQELSCIQEVNKAPEKEKQSVFEKSCKIIADKSRIAILALTLGLSQPAMAQNSPETNPNYQTFYAQIVKKYPSLSTEQHKFFATLYVKGLSVIDPKNEKVFAAGIKMIITALVEKNIALYIVDMLIEKQVLPPDDPYTKELIKVAEKIDKIGQEEIDKLKKQQEEARKQQEEARKQQEEAREKQKRARENIEFRSNMEKKFKNM